MLVCFSWLFALIAVLIKIDDPKGPVFFKQKRVGKLDAKGNPKYFTMYKFRSMCVDAESRLADLRELNEKTGPVFKIADDPRVTRVGKWLRKLSLDEMPQFVNALKGDISIVGPRPALPAEVATYNDYQKQRLLVKPGIAWDIIAPKRGAGEKSFWECEFLPAYEGIREDWVMAA